MGRKGMKGFLKTAGKAQGSVDEQAAATGQPPLASSKGKPAQQPEAKPAAAAAGSDSEEDSHGPESRSHMLQRHKKEMLAHKKTLQRAGKKSKDEIAKLSKEIEDRHAKELAALEAGAPPAEPAVAAAAGEKDSSSSSSKGKAGGSSTGASQAAAAAGGAVAEADQASKFLKEMSLGEEAPAARKPSKAQKRKEKQAAKDAEREARIAAELEALGTTERQAEEEALKAVLAPLGLAIKEIRADGHCMFRSVEDQLEQQQTAAEQAAAPGDTVEEVPQYSYQELRELAAEYIRTHKEEFAPFLLPEDPEQDPEEYYEKYCEKLEGTAVWGGHVELHALAGVLQRQIKVYAANMPAFSVGDGFAGAGKAPMLQLCYLEHAFGLGEHYNSVKQLRLVVDGGDSEEEEEGGEGGEKKVRWARKLTECDDERSD